MFEMRVYKPFYKKVGVKYIYQNILKDFKESYNQKKVKNKKFQ